MKKILKNNKKKLKLTTLGFTLIELIGIITILGIVVFLAVPIVKKVTEDSKQQLYNIQITNIESGLKNWSIDNSRILPQIDGDSITITLGQLKMGGYVDSELKNPKTNKCFGNDMTLTVTRYQKNYSYSVNDETGIETDVCNNYIKPYIVLNGEPVKYIELNDEYIEEGAIAKDGNGNDITSNITIAITGSGSSVDTSSVGNKYNIIYTVVADNETVSINRTIIVRDTTAPILTIPENTVIDKTTAVFDVLEGVSAIDNSSEPVKITTKSNVSFGIPGEYIITYTAEDSSGNKTVKKRLIKIV